MPKRTKNYDAALLDALRDPEEAAAYLAASLEDTNAPDSEQLFLMALKNVAIAHGMTQLARKANLGRESLYKALSENGDPKHSTLTAVLDAVGLRFTVSSNKRTHVSQGMMIHTRENLFSCDAVEWQTNEETRHCRISGTTYRGLPRRSKQYTLLDDSSAPAEWTSKEACMPDSMQVLAYGGIPS